jgi:hypothetical protein
MKKKALALVLALVLVLSLVPMTASAASDANNGDWSAGTVVLRNTAEAELMVRTGDIDALNDETAIEDGYDPFTAKSQRAHGYPWEKDDADPAGTDRIYVGSRWNGEAADGYGSNYLNWKNYPEDEYYTAIACAEGAMGISLSYDASGITVKNALLQLCIDDFQALSWDSRFTVTLNGKDAPFIAELLNQVDQTGPTSYIVSAIIPPSFYGDISSGKITVVIDETTGCGDGYAVDFVKLLVNYNKDVFTGKFSGYTEPGATVRLLGTSTTVTASASGGFTFEAVPGLNAVRASKAGYVESYAYGIVVSDKVGLGEDDVAWEPSLDLYEGQGSADIDFTQFGATTAWENAHSWAEEELAEAAAMGLIPDCLNGADLTKPITRAEFAAVSVKLYESLSGVAAEPAPADTFSDTKDPEVLKAYALGVTNGTDEAKKLFSPDTQINREQAATMLTRVWKMLNLEGWTLKTDGDFAAQFKTKFTMPALFADDAEISGFAKDSVYFMAANGIVKGMDGNIFAPKLVANGEETLNYATREQALLMSVRSAKNL